MTAAPALVASLFGASSKSSSSGSSSAIFYLFILIAVGFYFLVLRPQQRKAKALREQQNTFEVGDEVLTAGGIVGSVIDIDGERVTLETSVGASFVVLRQYVLRRIEPPAPESDTYDDEHEDGEDFSQDGAIPEASADADADDHEADDHEADDHEDEATGNSDSAHLDGQAGPSKSRSGRRARRGRNSGNAGNADNAGDSGGDAPPAG
jgi:preprotein translocase subunit YajC